MSPSQQFLRFAADCQSMAKLTGTDLSAVRSGLNAKASRQRKLNFEGGNRGPNSDNPISTVTHYHRFCACYARKRHNAAVGGRPAHPRPFVGLWRASGRGGRDW